ncbi:type II secretion system F family protein [Bacillaceae bacterium W0354]
MASFKYTAFDFYGREKKGKIKAYNEEQAVKQLRSNGLKIESIEAIKETIWTRDFYIGKPVKTRELVLFLEQFHALLNAGLTIIDSLKILQEQTSNKVFKEALTYIEIDMKQGNSYTDALKKHPHIFPPLAVNIIHSGEASGALDEALKDLSVYYKKHDQTRKKITSTLSYPIVVFIVAIAVVTFMMLVVVPQFVDMFAQFGADLPAITKFVVSFSHFLTKWWLLILLIFILLIIGIIYLIKNEKTREKVDYYLLKTPGFGTIVLKSNIANITRTLSSLLKNGVSILNSLDLVQDTINNREIKKTIEAAKQSLKQGGSLAQPFRDHWAYPYLVTQMITVGEKTGSLEEMLDQVATIYEEDVESVSDQLKALLEPVTIIFLSLIVGTIILSIVVPMFDLFNQIN